MAIAECAGILSLLLPQFEIAIKLYCFLGITILNLMVLLISSYVKNKKLLKENKCIKKSNENLISIKSDFSNEVNEKKSEIANYIGVISEIGSKFDKYPKENNDLLLSEIKEAYNKFVIRRGLEK